MIPLPPRDGQMLPCSNSKIPAASPRFQSTASRFSTGSSAADEVERVHAVISLITILIYSACQVDIHGWSDWDSWQLTIRINSLLVLGICGCAILMTNKIQDIPVRSFGRSMAAWLVKLQNLRNAGERTNSTGSEDSSLLIAVEAMANSHSHLTKQIGISSNIVELSNGKMSEILQHTKGLAETVRATTSQITGVTRATRDNVTAISAVTDIFNKTQARQALMMDLWETITEGMSHVFDLGDKNLFQDIGLEKKLEVQEHFLLLRSAVDKAKLHLDDMFIDVREANHLMIELALSITVRLNAESQIDPLLTQQSHEVSNLADRMGELTDSFMKIGSIMESMLNLERVRQNASTVVWWTAEHFPERAQTISRMLKAIADAA